MITSGRALGRTRSSELASSVKPRSRLASAEFFATTLRARGAGDQDDDGAWAGARRHDLVELTPRASAFAERGVVTSRSRQASSVARRAPRRTTGADLGAVLQTRHGSTGTPNNLVPAPTWLAAEHLVSLKSICVRGVRIFLLLDDAASRRLLPARPRGPRTGRQVGAVELVESRSTRLFQPLRDAFAASLADLGSRCCVQEPIAGAGGRPLVKRRVLAAQWLLAPFGRPRRLVVAIQRPRRGGTRRCRSKFTSI